MFKFLKYFFNRKDKLFLSTSKKELKQNNDYQKYSEDSLSDVELDYCRQKQKNCNSHEKFSIKNYMLKDS